MAETGTGDSQAVTRDQKWHIFANKYQIVVEDVNGKKLTMQHPYATIDECKEEAGQMKTRYPENKIYWNDELKMQFKKLDVYKRGDAYPYGCDFSKSYYSETHS
jgi:two-component SAPR family response regulator